MVDKGNISRKGEKMTDNARTPFRITRRGSDRYGWVYLAFVKVTLRTGWYKTREEYIGQANSRKEIYMLIENYEEKKK